MPYPQGSFQHLVFPDGLPPVYIPATILFSSRVETIPYSQFKQHITDGTLSQLTIGPENVHGTLKGNVPGQDQKFTTVRVNDPDLVKDLDEHKVNYSGHYESKLLSNILSWVIPIGIFFLIWRFAMKKMGRGWGSCLW